MSYLWHIPSQRRSGELFQWNCPSQQGLSFPVVFPAERFLYPADPGRLIFLSLEEGKGKKIKSFFSCSECMKTLLFLKMLYHKEVMDCGRVFWLQSASGATSSQSCDHDFQSAAGNLGTSMGHLRQKTPILCKNVLGGCL